VTSKGETLSALKLAKLSVEKLTELGVPPTPSIYTIWYHYFSDSIPELRRAIDTRFESGLPVDEDFCLEVFDRFFGLAAEGAFLSDVSNQLDQLMEKATELLSQSEQSAAAFGETLEDASTDLSETDAGAGALDIIQGVVVATREMQERSKEMESRLASSSAEISQLRSEVEKSRQEAATDGLTGLANRKSFDIRIREEVAAAQDENYDLCLLFLDVDHFKAFNDNHGHQMGDQVLKHLASSLMSGLKGRDVAARYGGEEFAVILPQTSLDDAIGLGNAIRVQIGKKKIVNRRSGKDLGSVTVSIGASQYVFGENLDVWIDRADKALYAAKSQGRDRILSERDIA